ncbi:GNAT family N-acetyltransferase [Salinibacterium sp. ZJ77]|uniref:GNAT family N-acetyltransferase n=1 Tax=Salinibacterium sp. ZJ77 TaxID=2708337 RepID=UPI0014245EFE|nr:GNAT family N-acetyltransferase [Salinibacterium sp. ZJ77]
MPELDPPRFRRAEPADAERLLEIERAAGLAAMGHIFPRDRFPYPTDAVLARWRRTLVEPGVTVLVEAGEQPVAFVAFDADIIRHLAVHPDAQGRGLGRAIVDAAVPHLAEPRLWCLEENHAALVFYARTGWSPTGLTRPSDFEPHPTELQLGRTRLGVSRADYS